MRILHCGRFGTPTDYEFWVSHTLTAQGHLVWRVEDEPDDMPYRAMVRVLEAQKIDLLLAHKPAGWDASLLLNLRRRFPGLVIAFWTPDWRRHPSWVTWYKPLAQVADITFATDGDAECAWWSALGCPSETLRQGFWPTVHYADDRQERYEVAFCGSLYTDQRQRIHAALTRKFGDAYLYRGNASPHGEAWGPDFRNLCASAKIIVADNFVNDIPGYWSDRVYLAQACGGFVLHPDVEGFDYSATYERNNVDDLVAQCERWLGQDEARESIRKKQHVRTRANDSYDLRCQQLIKRVKEIKG